MAASSHRRILSNRHQLKTFRAAGKFAAALADEGGNMAKREAAEYRAKLTNDAGVIRGKIPSPLVRVLGGRPGDYVVFNSDGGGSVTVSLSRSRGGAKKAAKGGKKKSGK
jgi:hypothetical protein